MSTIHPPPHPGISVDEHIYRCSAYSLLGDVQREASQAQSREDSEYKDKALQSAREHAAARASAIADDIALRETAE